jgi:predicted transcriptional regulator
MKAAKFTIRLEKTLDDLLRKASRAMGRSRSEVARDAIRRQLSLLEFESLRRRIMPFAHARGYLIDKDILDIIS